MSVRCYLRKNRKDTIAWALLQGIDGSETRGALSKKSPIGKHRMVDQYGT